MSRHTIKRADFMPPYFIKSELAGSYGKGSNKSLIVKVNLHAETMLYEIQESGKPIYETAILEDAIEHYNDLP